MTLGIRARERSVITDFAQVPGLIRRYSSRFPNGFGGGLPADGTALTSARDISPGAAVDLPQATLVNRPLWRAGGSNACPPLHTWTLFSGATFDATTGVLTLPSGATAEVYIQVNGAASAVFSAEFNAGAQSNNVSFQPNGGRLMNSVYFAADKTTQVLNAAASPGPYTTNGNARSVPVGSYSNRLVGGNGTTDTNGNWPITLGPNVVWLRLRITNDNTYGSSSSLLMRMPQLDLNRTVTEYVPPSALPLICSTEQNQRWFLQSGNSGLPLGKYTAYMLSAFGNVSGASRWMFGTRIGSSGSTSDRSMVLQSAGQIYTYSPTQTAALNRPASIPSPRTGRLQVSSHVWYDDAATLGIGVNGNPLDRSAPSGWVAGRQTYADFSGPLCLLGYSTSSSIFGGYAEALLYQGAHDTATRKQVERLLGATAGIPVPGTP